MISFKLLEFKKEWLGNAGKAQPFCHNTLICFSSIQQRLTHRLFLLQWHCRMMRMDFSPDLNVDMEACTYTVYCFGFCAWCFFLHSCIYLFIFIVETSQAMQSGIIKYYYNYSTNDSMKDYHRQGRCRTAALKGISSVTVTSRANNKRFILGTHWNFLIKILSCILFDKQSRMCCFGAFYYVLSLSFCKSKMCFVCFVCLCSCYSVLTDYSNMMFCPHSYIRSFAAK